MTQVLRTFNRLEQSRFEAFRRSTFRGDAISDYVAHLLAASEERAYAKNVKTRQHLGACSTAESSSFPHCPYVKNASTSAAIMLPLIQHQQHQPRQQERNDH